MDNNKVIVSIWEGTPTINAGPLGIKVEVRDYDALDNASDIVIFNSDEDNNVTGKQTKVAEYQHSYDEFYELNRCVAPVKLSKDEIEKTIGRRVEDDELKEIRTYLERELKQEAYNKLNKWLSNE